MRVLVTGGAGFIGSNFIRHMLGKYDYEIVNLDKLTYAGNPENLRDVEDNTEYSFVKGDVCDRKVVEENAKDCDAIINFAAETHVDRSIIDAGSFVETDVYGTYRLLEAARKYEVGKYVQISTDEVYGSIQEGSFTEESNLEPNSPYSASKAGGDLLVRAYHKTYGLPVMITRSSNNYGPYQYPEKIIPLFITNLIEGKKVPLYGDGQNVRDWLHVEDNCKAIDVILHKGKAGETYNIGGDCEIKNIDLTKKILELMEHDESRIEYVEDRLGHDQRYSLNTNKTKKLGWKPEKDFNQGLKETVEWYRKNKEWWKPLKGLE
ncbi:MAG: dTDP-glucose 4,6-dehydratase [Candidatus Altiarchaeota archaeon]